MTVTLSLHAERLVREQLARGTVQTPEEAIERALEAATESRGGKHPSKSPAEAVADILELQKRNTLGGLNIRELIREGRRY